MSGKESLIIYKNGEIELKVSVNKETVWLTTEEIAFTL